MATFIINDPAGTVQNKYVFDAWGVTRSQTSPVANPFGYTSREFAEVGSMYYRARYYNPNVGRFVSEDPIYAYMYGYVLNDPIQYRHSLGLKEEAVFSTTDVTISTKSSRDLHIIPSSEIDDNCHQGQHACSIYKTYRWDCNCICWGSLWLADAHITVFIEQFIPRESMGSSRRHERCHLELAAAAGQVEIDALESTPFFSEPSCKAGCDNYESRVIMAISGAWNKSQADERKGVLKCP